MDLDFYQMKILSKSCTVLRDHDVVRVIDFQSGFDRGLPIKSSSVSWFHLHIHVVGSAL